LGLFPKPEKGSGNTVNDYKRRSNRNMHPSLEEPILIDKSRLYKQTPWPTLLIIRYLVYLFLLPHRVCCHWLSERQHSFAENRFS